MTDSDRDKEPLEGFFDQTLPEIKYALGALIDRENDRSIPGRYAKLIPGSQLVVALRPDLADALGSVAQELEEDLTDSCTRHGSLYDRSYRVRLHRADSGHGPLYRVSARPVTDQQPEREPAPRERAAEAAAAPEPAPDDEATQLESGAGPDDGWRPNHFRLVVEKDTGEPESFPLPERLSTVGRSSGTSGLTTTISLEGFPHLSRRQLALAWSPRGNEPGFTVYNLGLNPIHVDDREVKGAQLGRGALRLDGIPDSCSAWAPPGSSIRVGEHGPNLGLEESEPEPDPDATVLE
ncbi:MAG: hypothetical protein ACREKN_05220 [Longimicrobiaceae bacterium]